MRRAIALVVLSFIASIGIGLASVASAVVPPGTSSTVLTGEREVPGPGDPNGLGRAVVSPRPADSLVCSNLRYRNIVKPTGAHIHEAPPTEAGPIVIDFTPLIATSAAGTIKGCVVVDPALARDVAQNRAMTTSTFTTPATRLARFAVSSAPTSSRYPCLVG